MDIFDIISLKNRAQLGEKANQSSLDTTNAIVATHTSQITGLASAAPKAVSLASQMTDTTKNYVYTGSEGGYTAGNWYYYNGSAWVSGGIYQSTGIADESIGYKAFGSTLQNALESKYDFITLTFTSGYYYNLSGDLYAAESLYSYTSIPVITGDSFKISGASYWGMPLYVFIDGSGNKIIYPNTSSGDGIQHTDVLFNANSNGTLYVNKTTIAIGGSAVPVAVSKVSYYKAKYVSDSTIKLSNFASSIQNTFNKTFTEQILSFTGGGYYSREGTFTSATDQSWASIPITEGDEFVITGMDYYGMPLYVFLNTNGTVKATYPSNITEGTLNKNCYFVANESGTLYINKTNTGVYNLFVLKVTGYSTSNPIYGKTMYADGDSIAAGAGSNGVSFVDLIGNINLITVTKLAVGGTTIVKRNGRTDSILERVQSMTGNYDYILLEGGYNDLFNLISLGTLTSGFTAILDETTVIGAVESMCKSLITNYPISKKLFVLGHRLANGDFTEYTGQNTYWDAIISALEKWSIPYIDLRKSSNLVAYNSTWLTNYFGEGETMGTHPNLAGYQNFYVPQITAKLKTL